MSYKAKIPLIERIKESNRILTKYPDRIPVICEKNANASKDCPIIDKNKYLLCRHATVGQFIYVIRKRLNIPANKALFLFIGNTIPSSTNSILSLYSHYKESDNFLYINYSFENTFG
jgi:GABA(A) receptor-associated protein